jgi:hypothetical protein
MGLGTNENNEYTIHDVHNLKWKLLAGEIWPGLSSTTTKHREPLFFAAPCTKCPGQRFDGMTTSLSFYGVGCVVEFA